MDRNQPYAIQPIKGPVTTAPQMVDAIILTALARNASDIHIGVNHSKNVVEPFIWRLRINGKLQLMNGTFMASQFKEVVARFKVLAGLNISELSVPQDGQISCVTASGPLVLRVSSIPGLDGEEIVMRLQSDHFHESLSLKNIGMTPAALEQLETLIVQESGLIILNGPAGSGKTSTIYAMLKALASPEKKILTAEDPIETRLPFVSHTQVSSKTNFNALARAFMRQDADIIFIGEVRDEESAGATIQMAQTGHLVLTTLHTRDAVGVISRLEAFQVHSHFIANTLIGSIAQRLVPKLCGHCRVPTSFEENTLSYLNQLCPLPQSATFFSVGPGCAHCNRGYSGRCAVFEMFVVNTDIAEMINRRAPRQEIFLAARQMGMRTLVEDILDTVYAGLTDLMSVKGYLISSLSENSNQAPNPSSAEAA